MSHPSKINHDQSEIHAYTSGFVIFLSMFLLLIGSLICFYFYQTSVSEEKTHKERFSTFQELKKLRSYENTQLNTLKWIDPKLKKVQVPIDVAIEYTAKNYDY